MSLPASYFEQGLSPTQFDQIQIALEQTAQTVGALVFTEALLSLPRFATPERFVVVISESFSALLHGQTSPESDFHPPTDVLISASAVLTYQTTLTFDPDAIRSFISQLTDRLPDSPQREMVSRCPQPQINHPAHQSQFTLKLIAALLTPNQCGSAEFALQQQIKQERLLQQVTIQIRQSLELPVILKTAVEQVRQFLQVDRLVIYQLESSIFKPEEVVALTEFTSGAAEVTSGTVAPSETVTPSRTSTAEPTLVQLATSGQVTSGQVTSGQVTTDFGSVIYEARANGTIPTVMNLSDAHCFVQELRLKNWKTLQIADAIDDVEVRYGSTPCLLKFLRHAQVRAKLVAPIRSQDRLWGLLIAHECSQPRHWQDSERRFLQQIAENLAIAISQSQLYAELQQQTQTLEQRVLERTQALQAAMQTAQAANIAKSEFLAAVSHELRTPLACIIGMSATLQRWSGEVLNERQQNFLQTIRESGEHLSTLINDILDLSQAEAGQIVLHLQEFSLSRLAQQTLKAFEGQASLQHITLALDLRLNPDQDRFTADPRRIRQILFNLISNAIKFTPERGKVTLRVLVQPNLVILQVKDTGIGIPDSQFALLFQKFQQLDAGHRREYGGTGLGLALTQQLVEMHGGWIEVESTVGVGSVFTVKLPTQLPTSFRADTSALQSQESEVNQQRIVLLEPDEETASFICDLLLAAQYQVVWILEGAAAMAQIEVTLPAVVLMNSRLSDVESGHVLRSLRQNPSTKHLKILVLSQSESEVPLWESKGANGVVLQPIHPEFLLQTIQALLSQA